jgi:hypothetical protein
VVAVAVEAAVFVRVHVPAPDVHVLVLAVDDDINKHSQHLQVNVVF